MRRGAYILADAEKSAPDVILIATGSEVTLCVAAREQLNKQGIRARLVSMPSWELFEEQEQSYREEIFPAGIRARVSVEAASPFGWDRYVGFERRADRNDDIWRFRPLQGSVIAISGLPLSILSKSRRNRSYATRVGKVNSLKALHDCGQSVWLDFLVTPVYLRRRSEAPD